jgi:cytochrome oxidase Cu insertion factor (SCO1/SenC/PrrC family)
MAAKRPKGRGRPSAGHTGRWAALGGALAVAALVWFATPQGGAAAVTSTSRVGNSPGDTAPVMRVHDIRGQTVALAGKPTVLYFMASWCSSCTYGQSQLREVHRRLGDRVNLVTVDVDPLHDTPAALAAFDRRWGGSWPQVLDGGQRLVAAYGIRSLDTMVILNGEGTIVYDGGTRPAAALDRTLRGLLTA